MPLYLVRRTFPGGLALAANSAGAEALAGVATRNAELGVTWLHSYVSEDRETMVCIYEGPTPDDVARASEASGLPVDSITRVSVLEPHFYH